MKWIHAIVVSALIFSSCAAGQVASDSKPISHDQWNDLLKRNVDQNGMVNYKGLQQDSASLNEYLDLLSANHPNNTNWNPEEQLAYWINAYNAFTLRLIIRNYPLESIKDLSLLNIPYVDSPWDIPFIRIEGVKYDLNKIEHGIIREYYDEPRIHFALVCAAKSCPRLRNEAYTPQQLDAQLSDQARDFLNDSDKNRLTVERAAISKIFLWYRGDFTKELELWEYVNQYTPTKLTKDTDINYMGYDWSLNEQ